jgi:hypothetical protein
LKDSAGNVTIYKVRSSELSVTDAKPVHADANLELQVASNTVSGVLRDSKGDPIPFATLEVWGESFNTDVEGRFQAPPLPPPGPNAPPFETITVKTPGFVSTVIPAVFGNPGTTFVEVSIPTVLETNMPPRVMLFRDTSAGSVRAGGTASIWAVFFDPDGSFDDLKPLTWDIPNGTISPSVVSIPSSVKTGMDQFTAGVPADKIGIETISWTAPQEEGYQSVSVRVLDKARVEARSTLMIPVANPLAPPPPILANRPPVPTVNGSATVAAGGILDLEALPNDPDGNFGMAFAWSVSPSDGSFSTAKAGRTSWTAPSGSGTYVISCLVTDPSKASGKGTHNIIVYPPTLAPPPPPNQPPAPRIVSLRTVTSNRELALFAVPNDPDGEAGLTYAWSVAPNGGSFSTVSAAIATWTAPSATGSYEVRCAVSDGKETVVATQTISVISDIPVSSPRRIAGYVRDQSTDSPISGALVVISGSDRYSITNADGYFQFLDVPAGTYTIIATRDGFKGRTFTGIVVPAN